MPLRARPGSLSGDPSGAPPAKLSLAAAAASATAAAPAAARHTGVHHGVRREGRGPRGYGGEVGDHTPGLRRPALRTLRRIVSIAHRAHEVEAILTSRALVLVEGHLYPTSQSTNLTPPVLYRSRRRDGSPASAGAVNVSPAEGPIILRGVKVPLSLPRVLRNLMVRDGKLPGQGSRCPPFKGNGERQRRSVGTDYYIHISYRRPVKVGSRPNSHEQYILRRNNHR